MSARDHGIAFIKIMGAISGFVTLVYLVDSFFRDKPIELEQIMFAMFPLLISLLALAMLALIENVVPQRSESKKGVEK